MKIVKVNILLFLIALPLVMQAGVRDDKYKKEKKINKVFTVNPNAALEVINKYGAVYVTTWDGNKTTIDVDITVSGSKESLVDKRLNSIDIAFNAGTDKVSAETKIGSFSGRGVSLEINYTVKIPKNNSINIVNQYGNVILGKINGRANITLQYGELAINELRGTGNIINLQYSDAMKISTLGLTQLNAQYSDVKIDTADELNINLEYGDLKLNNVNKLDIHVSYGDVNIGRVNTVSGKGNYSDIIISTLGSHFKYITNYGDVAVNRITKNLKSLTVSGDYSDITLMFEPDSAFNFQAKTSYADISGIRNISLEEKKEGGNRGTYKGYYRNKSQANIDIETNYGDITLIKL